MFLFWSNKMNDDEEEDYRFDSDEEEFKKESKELRDYDFLRSEYE